MIWEYVVIEVKYVEYGGKLMVKYEEIDGLVDVGRDIGIGNDN